MKLIVLKSNLLEALSYVEKAIGENANLPILKSVLMKTDGNRIIVTSTNLELAVTYAFSGKIVENGEVAIPLSVFYSMVRNLNAERVTLEMKNKKLLVSTDNYEATIQGQEAKDFPIIPSLHGTSEGLTTSLKTFAEALQKVAVAAQYSEIRPEISGVLLRIDDGVFCVATDSFRLAERRVDPSELKSSFSGAVKAIIPIRTVEELLKIFSSLEKQDGPLELLIDSTQILFKTQNLEAISRLIDGNFPEYGAIIPKQTESEIVVPRQELMNAVKLVSAFSGRANDIVMRVGENKKYIELYSGDASVGENQYKIPARIKGEGATLTFNWRYLLDGARIFAGEEIVLGVNSSDKPVLISSPKDTLLTYVVMPIKA